MLPEPVVTEHGIYGFFQEYRFLSNFKMADFEYDGILWPSSEHAYMACKTQYWPVKYAISQLKTASEAKRFGQTVELIPNWDIIKPTAMLEVLLCKFQQNEHLKDALLATGNKYLEETNWWNDQYWGVCKGTGLNMLGKTLMQVRDSFRPR